MSDTAITEMTSVTARAPAESKLVDARISRSPTPVALRKSSAMMVPTRAPAMPCLMPVAAYGTVYGITTSAQSCRSRDP
jgi:hypothetical protein